MLFEKRKMAAKNKEDRELIEFNSKSIGVLLALTEDQALQENLKKIQEELKFLIPSPEGKIFDFDKKIKAKIEDMKILFTKNSDGKMESKINGAIRELKVLIAERNSYR